MSNRFIGSGIIFPIKINNEGAVDIYSDLELIRSSILNILNWPKRQRYFNERFGSRIHELLEEPNDLVSRSLIRHFVYEAIDTWEKRVRLVSMDIIFTDEEDRINVKLKYEVRNTKEYDTFIFPFYKEIIY